MRKLILLLFIKLVFVSGASADWTKLTGYTAFGAEDLIEKNGVLYAGAYGAGIFVSYNNGANWVQRNNGLTTTRATTIHGISYLSSGLFIATTDGIFKSTDDGLNWVAKNNGIQIGPGAIYHFAYTVYEDGGALYAGTFNSIYKSTNDGDSWFNIIPILDHNDICVFHKYNNMLMAGTDGNHTPVIYTTNAGANWINMQINGGFPTGAFTIWSDPGKLFVGTAIGMWYSSNGGVNWTRRDNGLGADPYVFSLVKTGNTLFAGTNAWVYKTTNDGLNWVQTNFSGQTFQDVNKVMIHNNRIYVAAYTGLWYQSLDSLLTNVGTPLSEIADGYKLEQNYPNPFNPSTTINYNIPKADNVLIKVYDHLGKEIATLVNEIKAAGSYSTDFNATAFSSGIYFYKIQTGDFVSTKKMMLIK